MQAKAKESSYSQQLPNAIEAEKAVLGACFQDSKAVDIAVDILKQVDFYVSAHKIIFEHIAKLYFKQERIDIVTITDSLSKANKLDDIGGAEYIAQLVIVTISSANIETHCQLVKEKSRLRYAFGIGNEIHKAVYENQSADEILDLINKKTTDLITGQKGGFKPLSEYLHEFSADVERRTRGEFTGVRTHIKPIDDELISMEGGELTLLAARPRMGKTELALNIAKKNACAGNAVGIFSLEMMGKALAGRMVANEIGINVKRFRKGDLDSDEFLRLGYAINRIYNLPIYIEQLMGMTVFQIMSRARMLKNIYDVKLIIIDYIQLIRSHNQYLKKHELIGEIDSVIIELAKDLNIPILCLSQLSREIEKGKYRFPMLSDLSESGKLEQDANIIMFLERPELSRFFETEQEIEIRIGKETKTFNTNNLAIVEIAKYREGGSPANRIPLYYDNYSQDYVSVETYRQEECPFENNEYF